MDGLEEGARLPEKCLRRQPLPPERQISGYEPERDTTGYEPFDLDHRASLQGEGARLCEERLRRQPLPLRGAAQPTPTWAKGS